MRCPGVRALSLLFIAAASFALRPAGAADANAYAWQVRFADGGNRFAGGTSGSGFVSVTATQGLTYDVDSDAPLQGGVWVPQDYYGCISVTTPVGRDTGCATVPASRVMIDPALSTATLSFSVPSSGRPGKTLTASVTIIGRSTPRVQFNPFDVSLLPPPPASGVRYVGPMVAIERWGTVSGRITSQYAGGGDLAPYTGPPTGDSVAELSEGIVHQTSANWR